MSHSLGFTCTAHAKRKQIFDIFNSKVKNSKIVIKARKKKMENILINENDDVNNTKKK